MPQRFRLAVVHHQIGVTQQARNAEYEDVLANLRLKRDRRVAQGAERHRDRDSANGVIDDFVPGQNLERESSHVAVQDDLHQRNVVRVDLHRFFQRPISRSVDRRNRVATGALRQFVQVDQSEAPGRAPVETEVLRSLAVANDRDPFCCFGRVERQVGDRADRQRELLLLLLRLLFLSGRCLLLNALLLGLALLLLCLLRLGGDRRLSGLLLLLFCLSGLFHIGRLLCRCSVSRLPHLLFLLLDPRGRRLIVRSLGFIAARSQQQHCRAGNERQHADHSRRVSYDFHNPEHTRRSIAQLPDPRRFHAVDRALRS